MPIYNPGRSEVGSNATSRRIAALLELNGASGFEYRRYRRGEGAAFELAAPQGVQRDMLSREVPSYLVGAMDSYEGVLEQLPEVLDAALARADVHDRDSLLQAVKEELEQRSGRSVRKAAAHFIQPPDPDSREAVA